MALLPFRTGSWGRRAFPRAMAFPDPAANLIYGVLCLVPGFISLQTVSYATGLKPDTEFEKSLWSLIGSGISLSILYFLYVLAIGLLRGEFALFHSLELGWVDLVVIYPVLIFVAILVGYVGAKIHARTFGPLQVPNRIRASDWMSPPWTELPSGRCIGEATLIRPS